MAGGAAARGEAVSLYLHIPFCRELCWFCGCHTTVVRSQRLVDADLNLIEREIDLLAEGLPRQTTAGIRATVDATFMLDPQRVALYGYAHVPWMKRHQTLIDESTLPNSARRLALCEAATGRFVENG
ncbi:MAG: hypothetical protein VCB77_05190 [Alphaproteobacteria bacterium]